MRSPILEVEPTGWRGRVVFEAEKLNKAMVIYRLLIGSHRLLMRNNIP